MKAKVLPLAVAAALAGVAGSASAAFTYSAADTAVVNISGSSATNGQLKLYAANVLCDPANTTVISKDSNNYAYVCTPKAGAITGLTKKNIAIVKNSAGGSGNGISPLAAHSALTFINVFGANPLTDTVNAVPDIGVSDEEPALLVKAGAATGDYTKLISDGLNVVTFGVPVTLSLRNALQQAEITSGALPSSCTVGNESEACMPSLSKAQIASIFSGNMVDWSEIGLSNPYGDNAVYIARRVYSSGTQTDARAFFLNDPCSSGVAKFLPGDISNGDVGATGYPESTSAANACNAATYGGARVYEGSGGGNVETCVTNHERNHRWAISINSTELPGVSGDQSELYAVGGGADQGTKIDNKNYQRHIKIGGFAPTTWNVATGKYQNWVEAAMNTSNVYALSADAAALKNAMKKDFNAPAVLANLNSGFNTTALLHAAGDTLLDAGIIAPAHSMDGTAGPAFPATQAATQSAPVNYYTRNLNGTPNTCQPAATLWATGLNN